MAMSRSASDTLSGICEGIDVQQASMPPFSVLIAVYYADKASFFEQSLSSILAQTLMPSQVVLVCDGALPERLEEVIARFSAAYPDILDVVRTDVEQNQGLGKALALGLEHCKHSIVCRMDSDDISMPYRFERQIGYMAKHPEVDMLSSSIVEFTDSPNQPIGYRSFATTHKALAREARMRNPINHPAMVFRRERIQAIGGYIHFPYFEDYHLVARLLMNGGKLASLSEPLLYFRVSQDTYRRRRGKSYLRNEIELLRYFRKIGFISKAQYRLNLLLRYPLRRMPASLLKPVYRYLFRSQRVSK